MDAIRAHTIGSTCVGALIWSVDTHVLLHLEACNVLNFE